MPTGSSAEAGVNDLNVRFRLWRLRATSSSLAPALSAARSRTSWPGAARRSRSSTIGRRAWAPPRRRPACWRPSSKRATAARSSSSPRAASGCSTTSVARPMRTADATIDYQRTGTLDVALRRGLDARACRRHTATARPAGVEADLLDAAAVRQSRAAVCPPSAVGGLLIPTHGFVGRHRADARARRRGASATAPVLIERGRVRRIARRRRARAAHVENRSEGPAGDAVVLAAGSWAGQIADRGRQRPLSRFGPIRGQLLQLAWSGRQPLRAHPVERALLHRAVARWHGAGRRDGRGCGLRRAHDGRRRPRPDRRGLRACCRTRGRRACWRLRVGLRPGTPDHLPVIGWSRAIPNLMYATGHYRNGVLLAPLTAELVADACSIGRDRSACWS